MIPTLYGVVVLTAGLVLVYFGVKDLENRISNVQVTPTPNVAGLAARPEGGGPLR